MLGVWVIGSWELAAQTSNEVNTVTVNNLDFYNSDLKYAAGPGDFKVFMGGNSRDVKEADLKIC